MKTTVEQRLQALEDIQEIAHLKAYYCNAADCGWDRPHCDSDAVASLFVEDGVWDAGVMGRYGGREEIRAMFKSLTNFKVDFHIIGNPIIKVNGDTATGQWHGLFPLVKGDEDQAMWIAGVYNDEFVRTPHGWKFKQLSLTLAFTGKSDHTFEAVVSPG